MKLSRPVAVVAGVVLLAGGMVTADAATSTSPTRLCSNNISRVVQVPPKSGICPNGTTSFSVGSQADVAALAAANAALQTRVAELEPTGPWIEVGGFGRDFGGLPRIRVSAHNLAPGSDVTLTKTIGDGSRSTLLLGRADAGGRFELETFIGCTKDIVIGGVGDDGGPAYSEVIGTLPSCL
jgi:hypothetical protein